MDQKANMIHREDRTGLEPSRGLKARVSQNYFQEEASNVGKHEAKWKDWPLTGTSAIVSLKPSAPERVIRIDDDYNKFLLANDGLIKIHCDDTWSTIMLVITTDAEASNSS